MPHHRRRGRLLAAVVLGAVTSLAACSSSESAAGNNVPFVQVKPGYSEVPPAKRHLAPDLKGTTVTDKKLALSSLRGKVTVVNFWGSWCGPCRAEATALVAVAKAVDQVSFVGVDEKDTKTNARSFQRTYGVGYPSIFDEDGSLAADWPGASGPPYTFIIDRQGRIAARFLGGVTEGELKSAVLKVAAEA